MTNEQINIAIAEACGWTNVAHNTVFSGRKIGRGVFGNSPFGEEYRLIPNYCGSLDAMWEAEACLTHDQQEEFAYQLSEIVAPITGEPWQSIHASAMSRAKAFLRTFGKWEEGK